MRKTSAIDQIANDYVKKLAEFYPTFATAIGYEGSDDKLDNYSPEFEDQVLAEQKRVLALLEQQKPEDFQDEVTLHAMREEFQLGFESHEAGLSNRNLNNIASPAQGVRDIFDLSKTDSVEAWENLAKRMRAVSASLESYAASLRVGIKNQDTPAIRQVGQVIEQVEDIAQADGFFMKFAEAAKAGEADLPAALKSELIKAAEAATAGYGTFGDFLRNELMPNANKKDAAGRERYGLHSRHFLGAKIDIDETYQWGIEELARMKAEQEATAERIKPGASVKEAIEFLDNDPARKLHGTKELQQWMQRKSDQAVEELGRSHFDIAEPIRKLECMIAPTNHGGIYYTGPSDDFSRPGRMWWSVPHGVEEFNTWRELTTVYHEGVPGHHLQIAQQTYNRAELNDWRRLASGSSGHAEGWALYAERLMAELGYLDDPGDYLGMLDGQRMRAARVVLDIAVHCEKPRLDGTGIWDFDYALAFMSENVNMDPAFINFEVNRYFGWPGQAPSYKIGQRIWEKLAADATSNGVSQKEFHRKALNLGGLGLDTLKFALSR
ncbi:MAG: DUF885 domain-containing protein [Micrococcales bacterium]